MRINGTLRRIQAVCLILAALLLLAGCSPKRPAARAPAPDFDSQPVLEQPDEVALTGPEFVEAVIAAAAASDPGFTVEHRDGFHVRVAGDGTPARPGKTVDLTQAYQEYQDQPYYRREIIEGYGQALAAVPPPLGDTFGEVRSRVMPRIVSQAEVLQAARMGADWSWMPYVEDLAIAFVVDFPERYVFINRTQAAAWRVDGQALQAAALENLEKATAEFEAVPLQDGQHTVYVHASGDGYDSSRILLTRRLEELQKKVKGRLVIAIPSRDRFIAFGDEDPEFVLMMANFSLMDFHQTQYSITPALWTLEKGRVVPYRP